MKVYIVWYLNPELSNVCAAMWGIYSTEGKANKVAVACGFRAWVSEETVED